MPRLKGPVPQVQAKEGPMPQLVKKRRSGWAVLAAAALIASILAVGATPAAAAPRQPDQEATWKACLGPAMADQGFQRRVCERQRLALRQHQLSGLLRDHRR